MTSLLRSYDWEVLPHPAYSPDMSPPVFELFPKIKESLRGVRFEDLNTPEAEVVNLVRRIDLGCLATDIRDLPHRWSSVIKQGEDVGR